MTPQPAFFVALAGNPDLSLILVLAGILLIYAEFNFPGTVVLACLGTLSATLGVYALAQHPINLRALVAAVVAMALVGLSINLRIGQLLGFLLASLLGGSLHVLLADRPGIGLLPACLVSFVFYAVTDWLGRIALQARRNKRLPQPQVQPRNPTLRPAAE